MTLVFGRAAIIAAIIVTIIAVGAGWSCKGFIRTGRDQAELMLNAGNAVNFGGTAEFIDRFVVGGAADFISTENVAVPFPEGTIRGLFAGTGQAIDFDRVVFAVFGIHILEHNGGEPENVIGIKPKAFVAGCGRNRNVGILAVGRNVTNDDLLCIAVDPVIAEFAFTGTVLVRIDAALSTGRSGVGDDGKISINVAGQRAGIGSGGWSAGQSAGGDDRDDRQQDSHDFPQYFHCYLSF